MTGVVAAYRLRNLSQLNVSVSPRSMPLVPANVYAQRAHTCGSVHLLPQEVLQQLFNDGKNEGEERVHVYMRFSLGTF